MRMVIREEFQPHRANCKNISEGRVFSLKDNGKTLPLKSKSLPLKSKSLPLRTHEHRNLWNSSLKKKNFIQENIRTRHLKTAIKSEYLTASYHSGKKMLKLFPSKWINHVKHVRTYYIISSEKGFQCRRNHNSSLKQKSSSQHEFMIFQIFDLKMDFNRACKFLLANKLCEFMRIQILAFKAT